MAQILCLNNINPIQEIPGKDAKIRAFYRARGRNSAASGNEVEEQASHHITYHCWSYWPPDDKNFGLVSNLAGGRPGRLATEDNLTTLDTHAEKWRGGRLEHFISLSTTSLFRHHARRIADSSNCAVAVATNAVVGFQ